MYGTVIVLTVLLSILPLLCSASPRLASSSGRASLLLAPLLCLATIRFFVLRPDAEQAMPEQNQRAKRTLRKRRKHQRALRASSAA